ncbi:MAG TPA: prolyl oligopeptidase family serine peptidase [Candidatus Heimdallarchaeota archaeon]|nr:prolyl oligopeptidase family serine peptidase [Candidatus Heimdallarchaeota archaeon]
MKKNLYSFNKWMCVVLLIGIFVFSLPLGADSFTLEGIMSFAFPSHLIVSPVGDRIAWIFNQEGQRNIWVAEGPDYKPRMLTQYTQDDGQELAGLTFNFDGTFIVYVRGGNTNRAGEYPNPTSNPDDVKQQIWVVKFEGGDPLLLSTGRNPVTSPVENKVIFNVKGGFHVVDIAEHPKAKVLFQARGRNSSQVYSPDGGKLAFTSSREDHSFIGIYEFSNHTINWISPSVDMDGYPVWSPCGKYIAFIRFPGRSGLAFGGSGSPFAIWVADIAKGTAAQVWQCPDDSGGFAQYYPEDTLRWAVDGHLVFYSEHEHWMHLYSLALEDKSVICLSPGEYEVENSFLSKDGGTVIFNSNSGDIDRRHLWSVPVTGGKTNLLTPGTGLEWSPRLTSESSDLVFLCSTAIQPAAPAIMKKSVKEKQLIASEAIPENFPLNSLVEPEKVVIKAPDGLKIHCQLFLPKDAKSGDKRPAVIFMHGGPIRQMMLGWHMRGYYHNAYAMNQYLANKGYVVLSVNYRSGIGYGYAFRTAPNQGPRGASEYQDIVAAGRYLQNRPDVNPNKVGLWGGSYGGFLTAMGLARDSEMFAAGVDLHGVHDWSMRARRRDGGGWDIQGEDLMSVAYQSSPVADVDFWTSPVLFVHGDDDRNVDFIQTTDLVLRLRKLNKAKVELLIIPDEVHGFLRHENWMKVFKTSANYFDRFLRSGKQ